MNVSAKQWPAEIAKQTRLIESSFPGSAEEEITFWADLDRKLADTKEQLDSAPVLLTKLVLKRTNRVSEQLIREAEMELDKAIDIAQVRLFSSHFLNTSILLLTLFSPQTGVRVFPPRSSCWRNSCLTGPSSQAFSHRQCLSATFF